ncbi:hypothetical protein B0J11DRAFT_450577 [Dendryphion nanum]|uniref:Aminoglycoside phosphotransferase domain-containing protein n=1 Tax=Dendryphion nanum TaxID=256645 RepID=A0A9P9EKA0_9PLEO|nr:hypothetical protein B0J11DRAFT_450577 [Dendryphion nanum]
MRNWGPIPKIPDAAFIELIKRRLAPEQSDLKEIEVYGETAGSFNAIKFIRFNGRYVIVKVPSSGWGSRWTEDRAYILRSEVETMKMIHDKTEGDFPVPLVLDFDDTLRNEICAPYIIMEHMHGNSALELWYDYQGADKTWYYSLKSSAEKRSLRERFLWSLAKTMSSLQTIQFDSAGMLTVDKAGNHVIGDRVYIHPDTEEVTRRAPIKCTQDMYRTRLNEKYPLGKRTNELNGLTKFYDYILTSGPFAASLEAGQLDDEESFVLTHADFNAQNCLCDPDTGEVTAILDWEGAHFVPRCVGYASVPLFLRADWCYSYTFLPPVKNGFQNLPVEALDHYRARYAHAMRVAMDGVGDCVYTAKSHIYNAVHTSLFPDVNYFNGYERDVISKMLADVMKHERPEWVMETLGSGWELGETYLERGVDEFLAVRERPRVWTPSEDGSAIEELEGLSLE